MVPMANGVFEYLPNENKVCRPRVVDHGGRGIVPESSGKNLLNSITPSAVGGDADAWGVRRN